MTKTTLIGEALKEHDRKWAFVVSIIFGLTIFIFTAANLAYIQHTSRIDYRCFPVIIFLLIGIYLILDRHPSVLKAVGLYSIGVAINKLPEIGVLLTFRPGDDFFGIVGESIPILAFLAGLILIVLALNMCYTGYMYFTGRCRGYFFTLLAVVIMTIFQAYDLIELVKYEYTLEEGWYDYFYCISCIVMYITYMSILISDQVYHAEIKEHYRSRINQLRATVMSGYDGALSRKELEMIISGPDSWEKEVNDNPVESQMRFLVSYKDMDAFGTVQKWRGDPTLHFTISPSYYGYTMIEATRFDSVSAYLDTGDIKNCTKVTFMDAEGDTYTLGVIDHVVEVRE